VITFEAFSGRRLKVQGSADRDEKPEVWAPQGVLTIQRIAELKTELARTLANSGALKIDLAGVTQVDTAGLQLLCSAHRTASAMQKQLALAGTPPGLAETMRETGLRRHVGCVLDACGNCIWVNSASR
jgi:anti-anti-sigma regulatory factor